MEKRFMLPLDLQLFGGGEDTTGVELASVAGEQQGEGQETTVQTETGVESTAVAAQPTDEKSFASALKAREAQIQQQYEERYKGAETKAQMLDRVAKYYGYANHDEFQTAFDEAERTKQAQEEAQRLGIDEETYQRHLQPINEKLSNYERTIQDLKKQDAIRQIDADVARLKTQYPDFEQHQDAVFQLSIQRGYSLEDAYIITTHASKVEAAKKEAEQQVLANVTGRDQKQVLSSGDKPGDVQFDPEKMSLKDIEEISRRVQRGERITF